MRRFLVLAATAALLAAGALLAGCASRAGSTPPRGKPTPATPRQHGVFARPTFRLTPIASVRVGHAHRVNVRDLPAQPVRSRAINCTGSGAARSNNVQVTPSPAHSQLRICLPVGGTLTVAKPDTACHWTRPQVMGAPGVLHPVAGSASTFRAAQRGVVQLTATGSPPNGALAATFMWTAQVIVR